MVYDNNFTQQASKPPTPPGCVGWVILFGGLAAFFGYTGIRNNNINNNLDDDAIKCNKYQNIQRIAKPGLPFAKNVDVDGDTYYESIWLYNDPVRDRIMYRPITTDGIEMTFGEPQIFKKIK